MMMDAETKSMVQQACASRKAMYDMLAGLYYEPLSAERIEEMARTDYREFGEANALMASGFNDITRALRKRHTGTRQQLAVDFTASFGGTSSFKGKVAVPYASVFLSARGLLNQEPRNEVYFAYRKERLAVSNKSIPADHLSFELEFMGILSERIGQAVQADDIARAQELVRLSQEFLTEHVLSWFYIFKELALNIIKTRFYRGVLDVSDGYFDLDLEVMAELAETLGESDV